MTLEEELAEMKAMIATLLSRTTENETSNEPFGDWLLRWYELYKKPRNGVNTSHFMLYYIQKRISPVLGEIPLNQLSGDRIQEYLNMIERKNTRQKIGMIIRGSLDRAVRLRLIKYNPFDSVEIPTYKKKRYRPVFPEEQSKIVTHETNALYRTVFSILLCTGLRIGEFLALDESCVNLNTRSIGVYRSVDIRSGELQNRTKTYTSVRRVPFCAFLDGDLRFLLRYIKRNGGLTYNQVKLHFQRMFARLKMNGIVLHSLRHTFCCMAYRVGIPDKTIQKLMGHAALDVTMNVYLDLLGSGVSPFDEYFKMLKNDVEKRPADFWVFSAPKN